jgi:hypothetical protein
LFFSWVAVPSLGQLLFIPTPEIYQPNCKDNSMIDWGLESLTKVRTTVLTLTSRRLDRCQPADSYFSNLFHTFPGPTVDSNYWDISTQLSRHFNSWLWSGESNQSHDSLVIGQEVLSGIKMLIPNLEMLIISWLPIPNIDWESISTSTCFDCQGLHA